MFWIVTWPISHHFRDKRQFPSKIANFSHPHVYIAPAGIGYRTRASQSFNPTLNVPFIFCSLLQAMYSESVSPHCERR